MAVNRLLTILKNTEKEPINHKLSKECAVTTLFKGTTNGGANRVFEKNGEILIAGQAVGGRQKLDAERIADVWGGTLEETATLKEGASLNDLNDAKISVVASGGEAFIWEQLAAKLTGDGNLNQVEKFGPKSIEVLQSKFTGGLENALDRANIVSNSNGYEIQFGGNGVSGTVATNANFATEQEAQAFLDSLKDEVGEEDAYSVVVEDDDLNGTFQFEFEGWYRDVNAKKIDGKLEDSDIHSDGAVSSKAEGAAMNLALFLEQMANGGETFVFKELEDANAYFGNFEGQGEGTSNSYTTIGSKFTDLQTALSNAKVREDSDGFWEVSMSGGGLNGRVSTDADFKDESSAQEFIKSLMDSSGGFLDDALF